MSQLLQHLSQIGPLLFGAGFLAPLIAQTIASSGWIPPWGLSPLHIGLGLGIAAGLLAQKRGRWV